MLCVFLRRLYLGDILKHSQILRQPLNLAGVLRFRKAYDSAQLVEVRSGKAVGRSAHPVEFFQKTAVQCDGVVLSQHVHDVIHI